MNDVLLHMYKSTITSTTTSTNTSMNKMATIVTTVHNICIPNEPPVTINLKLKVRWYHKASPCQYVW